VPINAPLPILWIVGTQDPLTRPLDYTFDETPPHEKGRYFTVNARHLETHQVAIEQILKWLVMVKGN